MGRFHKYVRMKSPLTENVIADEANERTYVVMADRVLSDGEIYRAIRLEIMRRGAPLARGERVVITLAR